MTGSLTGGEFKVLLGLLQRFDEHDRDQFENLRLDTSYGSRGMTCCG